MSARRDFLESADAARVLLAHPEAARRWSDSSALPEMSVGSLCGHLLRSVATVQQYLSEPAVADFDHLLDAPAYWLSVDGLSGADGPDLDSDLHRSIRARAASDAEGGHADVLDRWDACVEDLAGRLGTEPPTRVLRVLNGRTMLLDEYLVTRLVEMLIHSDDLAVSLGIDAPEFPATAWSRVTAAFVETAVRRHGPLAVVRAMARVDRDDVRALRVL